MRIKFSRLPHLFQNAIAEKLDFFDYASFEFASHHSKNIANGIKNCITITDKTNDCVTIELDEDGNILLNGDHEPLCINVAENPKFRFDAQLTIELSATEELGKELNRFLLKTGSTASSLIIEQATSIECAPETLNQLLEAGRTTSFTFDSQGDRPHLSADFLRIPAMKSMKSIFTDTVCDFEVKDLLALSADRMHLVYVEVEPKALNLLLKEHMSGKRNIREIRIGTWGAFEIDVIAADLNYRFISKREKENTDKKDYHLVYAQEKELKVFDYCHGDDDVTLVAICARDEPFDPDGNYDSDDNADSDDDDVDYGGDGFFNLGDYSDLEDIGGYNAFSDFDDD